MRELLVATTNRGKMPEILAALGEVPFKVIMLSDIEAGANVEEPGETLEGNALIKAFTYGKRSGMLTLAEDTGLEVDALGGEPGVRTARFAPGTDADRFNKLLEMLKGVPDEKRGAQFRTVAALYDPTTDKVQLAEGACRGMIVRSPKGDMSFGYSPVFFVPEKGKTMGEMEMEERNSISHRGRAIRKMRELLLNPV